MKDTSHSLDHLPPEAPLWSRPAAAQSAPPTARRVPLHPKGIATVEAILAATAQLAEEIGHEAVTTNLIARAAGVNIATLYQYFSSKQAIILALFEQQTSERSRAAKALLDQLQDGAHWREPIIAMVEAMYHLRATQRGCTAIRLAIRSSPDLAEREHAAALRVTGRLAERLIEVAGLEPARANLVARCAVEIGNAFQDIWSFEAGASDSAVIEETKRAVIAYLAPYFERHPEQA